MGFGGLCLFFVGMVTLLRVQYVFFFLFLFAWMGGGGGGGVGKAGDSKESHLGGVW